MTLLGALILAGDPRWPQARFHTVAALAILGGLAYTIFSEWLNTEIRGSWAYADAMPQLPLVGAGLSPLAQWIVVPLLAFWWACPSSRSQLTKESHLCSPAGSFHTFFWEAFTWKNVV